MVCRHEAAPGHYEYWDSINPGTNLLLAERARATVDRDGAIVVYTPQMPHGQSHETTFAQIVADELGVPLEDVRRVWGDTDKTPLTIGGTGGSRGAPVGGGAVREASRELRRLVVEQAAQMLEAAPEDIDIVAGNVHVRCVPTRGLMFADIAHEAWRYLALRWPPHRLGPSGHPGGGRRPDPSARTVDCRHVLGID